ncbi:MAG: hypothetical protein M3Y21_04580, partial [Candidatus Eremiobacteraeota bacterium]|nr:hypothetical protein [Candidatus Eremiobacteraeota bacterium]
LYLRAIGLVTYAFFPSAIDQRGPLMFVKLSLTYALLVPPALVLVLGLIFSHGVILIVVGAAVVMIAQMIGLFAISTFRIQNAGASFATVEAA